MYTEVFKNNVNDCVNGITYILFGVYRVRVD